MRNHKASIWMIVLVLLAVSAVSCSDDDDDDDDDSGDDDTGDDDTDDEEPSLEPPINPYLADSPWPMAHRNPYCQASSPFAGPTADDFLTHQFLSTPYDPIFLLFSAPTTEGDRVVWSSNFYSVFKVTRGDAGYKLVDKFRKGFNIANPVSGAYIVLDFHHTLYTPNGDSMSAFRSEDDTDPHSPILPLGSVQIPGITEGDSIIGMNLTYDGWLAFATEAGTVGVMSRDFTDSRVVSLGENVEVSNSIALDEDGGIYVVTSQMMHRVQWTGEELSLDPALGAWAAPYEPGPDTPLPGRLGIGSGSTPSLMGTGDDDKLVVITDGLEHMNLVLYWRDEIPEDWEPIAPGKDRRIAAEVPINFGDPDSNRAISEQSVLVYGYDAAVVSNDYGPDAPGILATFLSNRPEYAPYGVEKFTWNPETRTLSSTWANQAISCPNGIPSMSSTTGLMYCIGQRNSSWTLEGIDWETGASAFYYVMGDTLSLNSLYAATEIGPDGNIVTGTAGGFVEIFAH